MSEENSFIPSLTLEPNAQAVAAAAQEAEEAKPEEKQEEIPVERLELEKLSPAEQAAVKEFSKKIDILNTEQVLNYGSAAQKNISEFSDSALSAVRTKDLGEVGDMLSNLVGVCAVCSTRPGRISPPSRPSTTRPRSTSTRSSRNWKSMRSFFLRTSA